VTVITLVSDFDHATVTSIVVVQSFEIVFVGGKDLQATSLRSRRNSFFRPFGACSRVGLSHDLRRGLHSFAASRLLSRPDRRFILRAPASALSSMKRCYDADLSLLNCRASLASSLPVEFGRRFLCFTNRVSTLGVCEKNYRRLTFSKLRQRGQYSREERFMSDDSGKANISRQRRRGRNKNRIPASMIAV